MTRFWAAILAVILLGTAAPAMAEGESYFTRLVIPVVNQGDKMVVLSLDEKITTPGHRYLDKKRAVTLSVDDPALDGLRVEHDHFLIISYIEQGIEPLCRVKLKTANTAGRPGSLLLYCAASSNDERCRLQVYSEAQVCYVLVTVR